MKTKTFAWMLPLAYAGWYARASAGPLLDPSTPAETHNSAVLFHFSTAVGLADGDELARQYDKYLGAGIVSGFMIEMASQWRNGAKQTATEAQLLATNLRTSIASIAVSTLAPAQMGIGTLAGATPGAAASGGAGVQVNDVGQVTQMADNNGLMSSITSISIQSAPLPTLPLGSALAMATQNGFTAQAQAGAGGVQIAITSPMDVVSQSVTPNLTGAAGSVVQVAQMAGNAQLVTNQLSIQLQMQTMSRQQLAQIDVTQALQAVAGLRH